MLDKLENMGLISANNGQLSEKQQIILLHIYKSRLSGEKVDVDATLSDIESGKITSYAQLLTSEIEPFFDGGFNGGIEKLHALVAEKRAKEGSENTFGATKKFEEVEERMKLVCGAFENKRAKLEEIEGWLGDENALKSMNLGDEAVETLRAQRDKLKAEYELKRLQRLPLATRYILSSEIRLGKYQQEIIK